MFARFLVMSCLFAQSITAHAYGDFPLYTLKESSFSYWTALAVLALVLVTRRLRFDAEEGC